MKVGSILLTSTCEIFTPFIAPQQDPFMAHLIATLTSEGFTFDLMLQSGCLVAACKQGAGAAPPSPSQPFALTLSSYFTLAFCSSTRSIFFFSRSTSLPSRLAHTRKVGLCERLCSRSSSRARNHRHSQHLCPASCFHFLPLSSEFGCFTKLACFYKDMTRCTHKCDHAHTHTHPFFALLVFYNLLIGSSINQHPQNT